MSKNCYIICFSQINKRVHAFMKQLHERERYFQTLFITCDIFFTKCKSSLESAETRKFSGQGQVSSSAFLAQRPFASNNEGALQSTVNARKSWHACFGHTCTLVDVRAGFYLPTETRRSLMPRWFPEGIPGVGSLQESLVPETRAAGPSRAGYSAVRKRARGMQCSRWLQRFTDFAPCTPRP